MPGTGAGQLEVIDGNAGGWGDEVATAGNVVFTTVTASTFEGTFDVTFDTGDRLTGTFSAPVSP